MLGAKTGGRGDKVWRSDDRANEKAIKVHALASRSVTLGTMIFMYVIMANDLQSVNS